MNAQAGSVADRPHRLAADRPPLDRPRLIAVDTETMHTRWGSVCQIGVAWRDGAGGVQSKESLISPPALPRRAWVRAGTLSVADRQTRSMLMFQ